MWPGGGDDQKRRSLARARTLPSGTAPPCLNQPFHSHAWHDAKVWSSSGARRMWIAVSRSETHLGQNMAESFGGWLLVRPDALKGSALACRRHMARSGGSATTRRGYRVAAPAVTFGSPLPVPAGAGGTLRPGCAAVKPPADYGWPASTSRPRRSPCPAPATPGGRPGRG